MHVHELIQRYALGQRDFSGLDLSAANLSQLNLTGVDFSRTLLRGANLQRTDLSFANLCGAHLEKADLTDASLFHANLRRARLDEANLQGADLRSANLTNAKLFGANLSDADLWAAVMPDESSPPPSTQSGWQTKRDRHRHEFMNNLNLFRWIIWVFRGKKPVGKEHAKKREQLQSLDEVLEDPDSIFLEIDNPTSRRVSAFTGLPPGDCPNSASKN